MKHKTVDTATTRGAAEARLCKALLSLRTTGEMRAFLRDLCTPAELEALVDRWMVVPHVMAGMPYRDIHALTAVSITTIGRVARFLNQGNGGYLKAAARVGRERGKAERQA